LGVALHKPLLGGKAGFVDSASKENKARAVAESRGATSALLMPLRRKSKIRH